MSNLLHVTILEPKILKVAPSFLERVWNYLLKGRVLDLAFPPEDGVETSIPGNCRSRSQRRRTAPKCDTVDTGTPLSELSEPFGRKYEIAAAVQNPQLLLLLISSNYAVLHISFSDRRSKNCFVLCLHLIWYPFGVPAKQVQYFCSLVCCVL